MDKFFQDGPWVIWRKCEKRIVFVNMELGHINFVCREVSSRLPEITRETFTAAALQAIEKLKAQGIDIGTDWLPKWEPKVGEVVCAWDDNCKTLKVGKYMGKRLDGLYLHEVGNHTWQHIAPFTGEIPEPFKSRWEAAVDANQ
jgi:peptidoglycan/xylan/chitin deacetylase (PgdA/CDA1 family)